MLGCPARQTDDIYVSIELLCTKWLTAAIQVGLRPMYCAADALQLSRRKEEVPISCLDVVRHT